MNFVIAIGIRCFVIAMTMRVFIVDALAGEMLAASIMAAIGWYTISQLRLDLRYYRARQAVKEWEREHTEPG